MYTVVALSRRKYKIKDKRNLILSVLISVPDTDLAVRNTSSATGDIKGNVIFTRRFANTSDFLTARFYHLILT